MGKTLEKAGQAISALSWANVSLDPLLAVVPPPTAQAKIVLFFFFQKNRGLPETCLAYSLFNVHIAGIHSNFVRERGTESNHVYQPIFSFLI